MGVYVHSYDWSERGEQGEPRSFWGKAAPMLDVSYYTAVYNCWLDQSYLLLYVQQQSHNDEGSYYWGVPVQFATLLAGNTIVAPQEHRSAAVGLDEHTAAIVLGLSGKDTPAGSHTIIAGNTIKDAPMGILINSMFRKTFLRGNRFQLVDTPIVDQGARTILEDNRLRPSHELIPNGDNGREFSVPDWVTSERAKYLRDHPVPKVTGAGE